MTKVVAKNSRIAVIWEVSLGCFLFAGLVILSTWFNVESMDQQDTLDLPIDFSESTLEVLYQDTFKKLEDVGLTKSGKIVSAEAAEEIFGPEGASYSGYEISTALRLSLANDARGRENMRENSEVLQE
ncbi:MAG: hypothetical protein F4X56_09785 [Gammaproteobacteria bacterium]|nr:hypothetical protein [Gammaproteobacteria bacterium]